MLSFNLQRFADEETTDTNDFDFTSIFGDIPNLDEYGDPVQAEPEPSVTEPEPQPEPQPQDNSEPEPQQGELQANEPPIDNGQQPPAEPEQKPQQSAEDNARFAEQRRQQQIEERARQLAQEQLNSSQEYQLAQFLSKQSGLPVDQVYKQLQQQALQQEAQQRGVPVEVLQEIQDAKNNQARLEQELNMVRFQSWQSRVNAEESALKSKYDFLTDTDWQAVKQHMLTDLRNPELPLEQAVFSKFGSTLLDKQREAIRQEVLAEMGGRKANPLAPQGAKPKDESVILTEEEKYVAKMLGLTEAEYAKNK